MATFCCDCLQPHHLPDSTAIFSYQAEPSACSTFIIGFQSIFWTRSRHYSPISTMKLRVLKFFPTCTRLVFCWPHFILGHTGPAFLWPIKAIVSSSIHMYFYLKDKNRKLFNKHFNTASNLHYATFSVSVLAVCL